MPNKPLDHASPHLPARESMGRIILWVIGLLALAAAVWYALVFLHDMANR